MSKIVIGSVLVLLCMTGIAAAQDPGAAKHAAPATLQQAPGGETLDTSVARLAVKAAFQPQAQPTQQELLSVILLMSLRDHRANRT